MTDVNIPPVQKPKSYRRSFATFRTVGALILREMSTRYGRTPGGYVWAILEPLGMILLLSVGFSLLVRSPSLGTSFILFYSTGFLVFNLYQSLSMLIARSIKFSRPLLFYPSVTWLDAIVARFVLNTLTTLMVSYILLTGILLLIDAHAVISIQPILIALSLAAFMGLSIGTLNCYLMGAFPIWEVVWAIATRPLFIASGVMFIYEDLPEAVRDILWYNPLFHLTGLMRMGFYPMYSPDYISLPYILGLSFITLTLGLLLLRKNSRKILNF